MCGDAWWTGGARVTGSSMACRDQLLRQILPWLVGQLRRRLGHVRPASAWGALMLRHDDQLPALLPTLSRGKHRNPRKGGCFMEFASLLAGEPWSDHPACTHPLLAAVARHVNDLTSDPGRPRLAGLIPSVIGLTGNDLHIDAQIALGSARLALPVAAAERQGVLAGAVMSCERVLAQLGGPAAGTLGE